MLYRHSTKINDISNWPAQPGNSIAIRVTSVIVFSVLCLFSVYNIFSYHTAVAHCINNEQI